MSIDLLGGNTTVNVQNNYFGDASPLGGQLGSNDSTPQCDGDQMCQGGGDRKESHELKHIEKMLKELLSELNGGNSQCGGGDSCNGAAPQQSSNGSGFSVPGLGISWGGGNGVNVQTPGFSAFNL